jgi:hypothetical protein
MPSDFDSLADAFASTPLSAAFGERDSHNDPASVVCFLAGGGTLSLAGCIVGSARTEQDATSELGTQQRDEASEVVMLHVPRTQEWGVFRPEQESSYALPGQSRPAERYYLDGIESLTHTWAMLRLVRSQVRRIQRGGVER